MNSVIIFFQKLKSGGKFSECTKNSEIQSWIEKSLFGSETDTIYATSYNIKITVSQPEFTFF